MNIRCLIGLHLWTPLHTIIRGGPGLPDPMAITGIVKWTPDGRYLVIDQGHSCVRCGKRRPA